jgi:DNA ligase-1
MTFEKLALYLEKLEGTSSRNEMTVILAELFEKADPEEARLIAYLTKGQLGPAYAAPNFAMADKMIIKALGEGAEELFKKTGDLGLVAKESRRAREYKSRSIKQVYDRLLMIANASGGGSQEKKIQLVRDLLGELDGVSAKYAVKMILGKLRTGFSDMTVLDSLAWMVGGDKKMRPKIEAMYNVQADLGEIAKAVRSQGSGLKFQMDPKIGTPVLMARAERAVDANEIWERLMPKCAVEYKLDGLRIQAHVSRDGVKLFSRGLEEVSQMYPDITSGLKQQITRTCIVEGEMIAEDGKGKFLPFQETVQRKRKHGVADMASKIPLSIFLFDVLMVEKQNVMAEGNEDRYLRLKELVRTGNTVKLIERRVVESAQEIEEFFKQAIEDGTEGIVAKKLSGWYQAGSRDFNWIKYKKSYDKSTLNDTIDAVVMGYDVGQGKRAAFGIGDFLIGVYSPQKERFLTVAKIGTGLSDEEWKQLRVKIQDSRSGEKPKEYEVTKQMECDFWVEPRYVVEIKADEITKSPMHTSGLALRFPRFVKWRDKKAEDATSDKELDDMYNKVKKGGDS